MFTICTVIFSLINVVLKTFEGIFNQLTLPLTTSTTPLTNTVNLSNQTKQPLSKSNHLSNNNNSNSNNVLQLKQQASSSSTTTSNKSSSVVPVRHLLIPVSTGNGSQQLISIPLSLAAGAGNQIQLLATTSGQLIVTNLHTTSSNRNNDSTGELIINDNNNN